ncbi:MAG: hypothetical protein IKO80_02545 [Lachnospiraceae bacterium]|nr:hypothetical protein [Lachnospiraceae bacterium]
MARRWISILLLILLLFPVGVFVTAGGNVIDPGALERAQAYMASEGTEDTPVTKANGSPFNIAYVDIDPYPATGEMLYRFIEQLDASGWITLNEELPFDPADTDAKAVISYLAARDVGPYLRFSDDLNYYISDAFDGVDYTKEDLSKRIANGEVDLIFCLGTWPADVLINEMGITEVPIMVSGTVDPVSSGLAADEDHSGKKNIWCHTNSGVYRNQMKFYHNSYPFTNIGMVFYDESIGSYYPYSEAAETLGFKITYRKIERGKSGDDAYYSQLKKIYQELVSEGIDAFLLNTDMIWNEERIPELLDVFYEKNIPVFVQSSEFFVEDGATMIVTASDATAQAPFLVHTMSTILHGGEPGSISQRFATPPFLSVNLEVADRIGFPVDDKMLLSAERIYSRTKEFIGE